MRNLNRKLTAAFCSSLWITVVSLPVICQAVGPKQSGAIAGRVTLNGKPVSNVPVLIVGSDYRSERPPLSKVTTDRDGMFRIGDVPAGTFRVSAYAPALVAGTYGSSERIVTLARGETIENVDISLIRGGVITGKVTDTAGRPIVEHAVNLETIDEQGKKRPFYQLSARNYRTDDRGVYRIYGLQVGRYLVSAGELANGEIGFQMRGGRYYPLTYYPGGADASKADVVEVAAGAESTGIDIVLGRLAKTYSASGRITDAASGKPLSNVYVAYGVPNEGGRIGGVTFDPGRSDEDGRFCLEGIPPNHYAVFALKENGSDYYGDPVLFDITEGNVYSLEVKLHRGASISGVAIVEGSLNPDVAEKASASRIIASTGAGAFTSPFINSSVISSDGTFRIAGLRAGKVSLSLGDPPPKFFALIRVERDGIPQAGASLDIADGEQVFDVRVILRYGTGVIRGVLKISGGEVPVGSVFAVTLSGGATNWATVVDDRGRFVLDGIPAGNYELSATAQMPGSGGRGSRVETAKKQVTVTDDTDAEVTILIDLNAKQKSN